MSQSTETQKDCNGIIQGSGFQMQCLFFHWNNFEIITLGDLGPMSLLLLIICKAEKKGKKKISWNIGQFLDIRKWRELSC